MIQLFRNIFGTKNDRDIKVYQKLVNKINDLEETTAKLSDEALQAKTDEFRNRYQDGQTLDDLLPEAFAVAREASKRVLQMRHFDVQLIGGMVLHEGKIAEMKTGEGKTLTATLAMYLNAIAEKGCHLITVNDYLAKRDSEWMGKLYGFLGLKTGLIVHGLSDEQRKEAYHCDITYGTNNEFGFDYLRDNMKTQASRLVQRDHFFAIVDEVDSILIDEARTPLIISGPTETNTEIYATVNDTIPGLYKDSDYLVDEKGHNVMFTEDGVAKVEKRLRLDNLYDPKNIDYLHHVQQALKAHVMFKKDVDYVVRDNQLIIVDEHTGRMMPGRRYSDGLHGALEAKEHLPVQNENQTLATITFQNFFRMYDKLAGMTGTADTEAVEFKKIYNLDVVVIPTNKPLIRNDRNDVIYLSALEKFNVIADDIASRQKKGQPILVGTVSVEKSELLSSLLKKRSIPHEILNAKNHSREATIIANAGKQGNVTISTNMAGRGTDIVLGEGVRECGGLCVIGTERHESRRIDNQLRGRSGRQGDPGETIFYLSLEDDLIRIFAADRLVNVMSRLGMKEGEAIEAPMVTRAIAKAQKRVEEQNFASRKHLLEYDDVMNQQRKIIYARRRKILDGKADLGFFEERLDDICFNLAERFSPEVINQSTWDFPKLVEAVESQFKLVNINGLLEKLQQSETQDLDAISEVVRDFILAGYQEKKASIPDEVVTQIENYIYMQIIDQAWKDNLASMDQLRESVSLRGYAQKDPLQEYKKEAFRLFEDMVYSIEEETVLALVRMPPPRVEEQQAATEQLRPKETDFSGMSMQHPGSAQPTATQQQKTSRQAEKSQGPSEAPFVRSGDKVGRNDPCPCGSGKKYKKCHGGKRSAEAGQ